MFMLRFNVKKGLNYQKKKKNAKTNFKLLLLVSVKTNN